MTVLLFVATIITFLAIDYFVRRSKPAIHGVAASAPAVHRVPSMRLPEGIYFSKTHTWLNLFPSGKVHLGVDDFAGRMFANPHMTLLKKEGEAVRKGDAIIRLEEAGKSVALHAPLSGRITKRNARYTTASGSTAADDLFLHGWAYQIEPNEGASVVKDCLLGTETRMWMKGELSRLRDFMAHASRFEPVMLQDGGEPMPGVLSHLSTDDCARFEEEFLAGR
ncbi:MAG: hypothetical protein ACM3Q4_11845 [Acidobacteriota bacterium]